MRCIASTYCCCTGCRPIRRTAHLTISSTSGGETLTFGCNVTGIKHLQRSSRSYPKSTGSSAGGSELRVDIQISVWMCARLAFFSNASLEGDSVLTSGVFVTFSIHPSRSDFNTNLGNVQCHRAYDKLIPNFALAGSVLSRIHGFATFVHERLEWTLVDQCPEKSETECSAVSTQL